MASAPNDLFRVGALLQGKPDPGLEWLGIEEKIKAANEDREIRKQQQTISGTQNLTNFLKITAPIMKHLTPEQKDAVAEDLAQAAGNVNFPVKDKAVLRLLMEAPEEADETLKHFDKVEPSKFEPESVRAFEQSIRAKKPDRGLLVAKPASGTETFGHLKALAVLHAAAGAEPGTIDPTKLRDAIKDIEATPQGMDSRVGDYLIQKHKTGKSDPAMEKSMAEYMNFRFGTSAATGAGTQTGKETAKMGLPLRDRATKYINPETLTTPPPDLSETDALKQGYRAFSGSNAPQFVTSSRAAFEILNRWEALLPKIYDPKGTGFLGRIKNLGGIYQAFLNADPDAVEFFALQKSTLPLFARSMGDVANIAVAEQQFQETAMPKPSDTFQTAQRKISSRKAILQDVLRSSLGIKPIAPSGGKAKPKILSIEKAAD